MACAPWGPNAYNCPKEQETQQGCKGNGCNDVRTGWAAVNRASSWPCTCLPFVQSISREPPSGPVRGVRSLVRKNLGEVSVFRKVRLELLRPILDLLGAFKRLRMCC